MVDVRIDNKLVKLSNPKVIGMGGEATVFKHDGMAVKVFHQPNNTREQKLKAMLPCSPALPPQVIAPQKLVTDSSGKRVAGFTMRLLDANYTEARQLSTKKFRAQSGLTSRDIVRLFLNTHATLSAIHGAGMVVGDLNDLNLMFKDDQMLFIDADSFQFDRFPCLVGTEAFIDPVLYGKDLSTLPQFHPNNDWYAYAVLLFKSLLLTHPYGGVHPTINLLTHRAQQRVTVFDPTVKYPRIAYSPDLISDDLAHEFEAWFAGGKRDTFPVDILQGYLNNSTTCTHCGAVYPTNRSHCPVCATVMPITVPQQVYFKRLLQTAGDIIAWHVEGKRIRVLAQEDGKVIYYDVDRYGQTRRVSLFNIMPTATYAFLKESLVISPARDSDQLMIVDLSGEKPAGILQTTTAHFASTQPVFGTSRRHLYRIAGGYLMRGRIEYGQLIEQSIMAITENQTWFTVDSDSERVFGYFRLFNNYTYWLLNDHEHVEAQIAPMDDREFLIDIHVLFAPQSVLILRQTQHDGVERVRVDEIDLKGRSKTHYMTEQTEEYTPLHNHAYMTGVLLQPTDAGIIQRRLDNGTIKTFAQTEPIVQHGDAITSYERGILVIQEKSIGHLTI